MNRTFRSITLRNLTNLVSFLFVLLIRMTSGICFLLLLNLLARNFLQDLSTALHAWTIGQISIPLMQESNTDRGCFPIEQKTSPKPASIFITAKMSYSNTNTGAQAADPYKQKNMEETSVKEKVEGLTAFIDKCKFCMMTTKTPTSGELASRCMALAAKVCLHYQWNNSFTVAVEKAEFKLTNHPRKAMDSI